MGGKISVQSEVGRGSLFTVRIPRVTIVGDESPIPTTGYNTPSYTPPSEVQSLLEEKEEKPLFNEGKRVRTKRTVLLTKPFSYKELELRIQNILKRQEQLHDLYKRDSSTRNSWIA